MPNRAWSGHVVAAALANDADIVVTDDRRLRREIAALDRPLRAVTADDFAVGFIGRDRTAVEAVIDDLIAKRVRRPVNRDELLDQLGDMFPSLVATLESSR